jgi:hypothetical protein
MIELGIIVLGVVIGLQASNWNARRATEVEVRALIQNLRIEFRSSRASLAATRTHLDRIMDSSRELLALFGRQDIGMSEVELDRLIEMTFFWPTWSPSDSVSRELINSGYLSVLDEDGVKPLLFEWERTLTHVEEWNRRMERSSLRKGPRFPEEREPRPRLDRALRSGGAKPPTALGAQIRELRRREANDVPVPRNAVSGGVRSGRRDHRGVRAFPERGVVIAGR